MFCQDADLEPLALNYIDVTDGTGPMVTAAPSITTTHPVAVASASSYSRRGHTVVATSLSAAVGIDGLPGSALLVADAGIAECVLEDRTDPALMAPGIEALVADGWEVTVLVPAPRMGAAHWGLRGSSAMLQAWCGGRGPANPSNSGRPRYPERVPPPLYTQPVVAFIWDFDRTLIPSNQQDALFDAYGVDPDAFWREVDGLTRFYQARGVKIGRDAAYLLHILTYVREGIFEGLTNARLRELGAGIEPAPGIPEFFEATRRHVADEPRYSASGITVEHYTVSTGILPMIEGSPLAPHLDGIWANTFVEEQAPPGYLSHLDMPSTEMPISALG